MKRSDSYVSPFDSVLAAFVMLTRLPFWRIKKLPAAAFEHVTDHWSLVGWLTGAVLGLSLYLFHAVLLLPLPLSIVLAFLTRLLLTGALHEDGLADFFDAMGAGGDRTRILRIMKDTNTGAYAMIGLIGYVALLYNILVALPFELLLLTVALGDPLCKGIAAQLVNTLPYARPITEAKVGVVYRRMGFLVFCFSLLFALIPFILFLPYPYHLAVLAPCLCFWGLYLLFRRRIGGYTGDCCGASFLLCELSFWLGVLLIYIQLQQ